MTPGPVTKRIAPKVPITRRRSIASAIDTRATAGTDISVAIDCAASEFFKDASIASTARGTLSAAEWTTTLASWCDKYPIVSIEDGMAENDWTGWEELTQRLGDRMQLVGDDIFVTNTALLREGIRRGVANSILIKINQIGTLTETFAAIELAKRSGYTSVISHRSGETEDTTIADIAAPQRHANSDRSMSRSTHREYTSYCASRKPREVAIKRPRCFDNA